MNNLNSIVVGRVASLHLHPNQTGDFFKAVEYFNLEIHKGIVENPRYFARRSRNGDLSKRQVSLIAREQITQHAEHLGLGQLEPGIVRSNIETAEIDLITLIGEHIQIGESAVLFLYEARTPCFKMDKIATGLKDLMANGRQGVMAQVIQSGRVKIGDEIRLVKKKNEIYSPSNA